MIAYLLLAIAYSTPIKDPALPKDFIYGVATAAYQVEGAAKQYGRGPCIWDTFSSIPGKTFNNSNGDVAADQYHHYEDDFKLLKKIGAEAYRMSFSWSRIIPNGKRGGPINQIGIAHYHAVLDSLISKGIQPFVTMYHWDLPQFLDDEYGGFLDTDKFIDDFTHYAELLFKEYGHKVKNWMTFNEPHTYCKLGYGLGIHAPGRCDDRTKCPAGNAGIEVWRCGHTTLLAHAHVAKLYKEKYKSVHDGRISIVLNVDWSEPLTSSQADVEAARRKIDFTLGWLADPIYLDGEYPETMRAQLGDRLPRFTEEEKKLVINSSDYFSINHYTTNYVIDSGIEAPVDDMFGNTNSTTLGVDGTPIGPVGQSNWLFNVPRGFKALLLEIDQRYNHPVILVTENGFSAPNESTIKNSIHDIARIDFYKGYLTALTEAVAKGCNVIGYFAWSMVDNFEWASGYSERFGIVYVDFETQKRHPKDSSKFIRQFIDQNTKQC